MGDDAVALLEEEQHLRVPVVGAERPAVMEDDRLPGAPVLVEDLRAVLRGDGAHPCPFAATGIGARRARTRNCLDGHLPPGGHARKDVDPRRGPCLRARRRHLELGRHDGRDQHGAGADRGGSWQGAGARRRPGRSSSTTAAPGGQYQYSSLLALIRRPDRNPTNAQPRAGTSVGAPIGRASGPSRPPERSAVRRRPCRLDRTDPGQGGVERLQSSRLPVPGSRTVVRRWMR